MKDVLVRVEGPVKADPSSVLAFTALKAGMEFEARLVAGTSAASRRPVASAASVRRRNPPPTG
ncbi:MAG: hypothetical protein U1F87_12710 [Kiritimatiellia bacterium]